VYYVTFQNMQTALHIASDYDDKAIVDMLIDRGADTEAVNKVPTLCLFVHTAI
jgi:ankyrin repeat protein